MLKRIKKNVIYWVFAGLVVVAVIAHIFVESKIQELGCKPSGETRLTNSMLHGSDSALTTLVYQEQWKCRDGSVIWRTPLN